MEMIFIYLSYFVKRILKYKTAKHYKMLRLELSPLNGLFHLI